MILKVHRAHSYEGHFPDLREPSEIGGFSLDFDRQFCDDKHQLKYVSLPRSPQVHFDLSAGYEQAIRKEFGKTENIDSLLHWVLNHQEDVQHHFPNRTNKSGVDFVCYRGLLTKLCCTVYENREDWLVCATRYRSVVYLVAFDTEQDVERRDSMTERDRLMSAWGYKFEQYVTSDAPGSAPDPSVPVNEKEEFNAVMKGRLNGHALLFSAEVDGVDPAHIGRDPASMGKYVEFKTSRIIETERQRRSFCRFKLLKWWLQSFLAGIPKIVCGFRDDDGIVRTLEEFPVRDIPKMAQGQWSPAACLNFLSLFFDHVNKCVTKDDPNVVYQFRWSPRQDITCEELTPPHKYQILPDWYVGNVHF
ncbi:decapping and exoribonuclease protein-like [Uloborus diversus]|uniref:decapping and exoribonuclease protein-like n=1 Tax=Uloborus diversus TaxID=327109 RepID=UPI002409E168|nr:decapping and exoribonuclease protein-like [Uloborus diversus]